MQENSEALLVSQQFDLTSTLNKINDFIICEIPQKMIFDIYVFTYVFTSTM